MLLRLADAFVATDDAYRATAVDAFRRLQSDHTKGVEAMIAKGNRHGLRHRPASTTNSVCLWWKSFEVCGLLEIERAKVGTPSQPPHEFSKIFLGKPRAARERFVGGVGGAIVAEYRSLCIPKVRQSLKTAMHWRSSKTMEDSEGL
jgi:hypothetical protein